MKRLSPALAATTVFLASSAFAADDSAFRNQVENEMKGNGCNAPIVAFWKTDNAINKYRVQCGDTPPAEVKKMISPKTAACEDKSAAFAVCAPRDQVSIGGTVADCRYDIQRQMCGDLNLAKYMSEEERKSKENEELLDKICAATPDAKVCEGRDGKDADKDGKDNGRDQGSDKIVA